MGTIKDKFYFVFDGKNSKDFGILNAELSTGMYEESFGPSREIVETEVVGRDAPIFHGINDIKEPFDLNLIFEDDFDNEKLDDIQRWLFKDYYKPLYFEGNEDRIMYVTIIGDPSLIHNGLEQGYFTVTVHPKTPYKVSQIKTETVTVDAQGSIQISNYGHKDAYPELSIEKIGNGDLIIGIDGRNVKIINLTDGESIYIDTLREIIETDIVGEYRYDNITAGELEDLYVGYGDKAYNITGSCIFSYRFREKYRF